MELILINDSKLKIMLDEQDMRAYNICDEGDCSQFETRKAIRDILDRAREEIGFNTEGAEIFVQLYSSKKGGCELFVTKNPVSASALPAELPDKKVKPRKDSSKSGKADAGEALSVRRSTAPTSTKRADGGRLAFSFSSLRDICTVCRRMNEDEDIPESRAFRDVEGSFYLLLWGTGMSAYTRLDRFSFISEFGARERFDDLNTYLGEYGRIICPDKAIQTLAEF
jgi:negative regulator of genetic competence, sporulation and motility